MCGLDLSSAGYLSTAYPSLKKMGKARARREGNYASSNSPPREDITNLELGLTLLPGSQTQRGERNIFNQVAPDSSRAHGKGNPNPEQDDRSPIGHRNEPRPSRVTSPSIAQNNQRESQTLLSPSAVRQHDEENEVENRGVLPRKSSFGAQASDAKIDNMSCRRVSSTRIENGHTDGIEVEGHEGMGHRQDYPHFGHLRKSWRVDHCHTHHSSRSYINRASQARDDSSHSGMFQVLRHLDICKDVPLNDVEVLPFHVSAGHHPRLCHDRGESIRLCALSAGDGNEGIDIEILGQNDVVKTGSQSCRYRGRRCSKAREPITVNGGEGLEMEINAGSDSLNSASASVSASRRCETYLADSFNGNLTTKPDSAHGDNLTGRHWHRRDDDTDSVWEEQEVFGTCLPGASHHPNLNLVPNHQGGRNEKTLVPGPDCDDNYDDGEYLLSFSSSSSSSSSSIHHIPIARTVPFKINLQRRATISTTFSISHILADSRKRSTSLPGLRFIKSFAAMDYSPVPRSSRPVSQEDLLSRPVQCSPEMSSTTPVFSRLPYGQSGWAVPAPELRGVEASLATYTNNNNNNNNMGIHSQITLPPGVWFDCGLPVAEPRFSKANQGANRGSTVTSRGAGRKISDLQNHYGQQQQPHMILRSNGHNLPSTSPTDGAVHQSNPMDIAYAQSVNEVKRLKARVQKLESDNRGLVENVKRCDWEMSELRMRFEQRHKEVSEKLQSKTKEVEDQRAETQLWRHRTEQVHALSRKSGPKRSSAATIFNTMGCFSPEANFSSQPILPFTGPVVGGATETNTGVQLTTEAQCFSVSPEAVTQAPAAPIQARAIADSTGTSAATSIDLTIDESPDQSSISPLSPASSSDLLLKAQGLGPIGVLQQRVKSGADWMGEAHPWKGAKRPAAYGPDMEHAAKRVRLDKAVSARYASMTIAEAAKTASERNRAEKKAYRVRAKAKAMQAAVQRKKGQEQHVSQRARELERETKLRDDHKKGQALVTGVKAKEKAEREAKSAAEKEEEEEEEARKTEEQHPRLQLQEEALDASSNDEDPLAYLFEATDSEEIFPADERQVDGEGEEDDDGLEAELEAAMAKEMREDDGLEAELEAAMAEEKERG